eukprot:283387_1
MSALQSIDSLIGSIDSLCGDQKETEPNTKSSNIPVSKHFIQTEETAVIDSIDGQLYHDNTITKLYGVDSSIRVVIRKDWKTDKRNLGDEQVAVISGGGSGHYPSFWGFVGTNMLSAAVCGGIFAAPPTKAILETIRAVAGTKGVIMLYNNYTGDILNFSLAAKIACTKYGINVQQVLNGDDCALTRSKNGRVGRRGLAGGTLIMKIIGYYSEIKKCCLDELVEIAKYYTNNIGTIAIAATSCYLPGQINKNIRINENKLELGMGAHGEPGAMLIGFDNIQNIIPQMFNLLLDETKDRNYLPWLCKMNVCEKIVLLINNMGGLAPIEEGIIKKYVIDYMIEKWGIKQNYMKIERIFVGAYITSFDMRGFSITILRLNDRKYCDILDALDARTGCKALIPGHIFNMNTYLRIKNDNINDNDEKKRIEKDISEKREELTDIQAVIFKDMILKASNALINAKDELNKLDSIVGDGDCGNTLAYGAVLILDAYNKNIFNYKSLSGTLLSVGELLSDMGGSSGALYGYLFICASNLVIKKLNKNDFVNEYRFKIAQVLMDAVNELSVYCGAKINDRTMLDALIPAVNELVNVYKNNKEIGINDVIHKMCIVSENGVKNTQNMIACVGRTSYLDENTQKKCVDPGAKAVDIWLKSLKQSK